MKHEVLSTIGKMYEDSGFGVEQVRLVVSMLDELVVSMITNIFFKDYAKAAEFYREAADEAMAAGKGRIATKLYEQAEICEGMLE